jgi:hypothetical protein
MWYADFSGWQIKEDGPRVGGKDEFPELLLFEEVVKPITLSQFYPHRCGVILDSPLH